MFWPNEKETLAGLSRVKTAIILSGSTLIFILLIHHLARHHHRSENHAKIPWNEEYPSQCNEKAYRLDPPTPPLAALKLPPALLGWTSISHINLHPHKSYRHSSPHKTKKQRSQSNQLSEEGRGGERKALPSLIIWGYEGWFREGRGERAQSVAFPPHLGLWRVVPFVSNGFDLCYSKPLAPIDAFGLVGVSLLRYKLIYFPWMILAEGLRGKKLCE